MKEKKKGKPNVAWSTGGTNCEAALVSRCGPDWVVTYARVRPDLGGSGGALFVSERTARRCCSQTMSQMSSVKARPAAGSFGQREERERGGRLWAKGWTRLGFG